MGKPTHIVIRNNARQLFYHRVVPRLRRYSDLVYRVSPNPHGRIVLARDVVSEADLEPLLALFREFGIPRSQIFLEFEEEPPVGRLRSAASAAIRAGTLDLGADVAEKDEHLARYFVTTAAFQRIANHQKHIIVGPKGSGKSAILKVLREVLPRETEGRAIVVTPEDYATDVLGTILKGAVAGEMQAFITTWKYTLLIEVFRKLTEVHSSNPGVREIREYLVSHKLLGGELTLFERFIEYLARIREIKGGFGGAEVGVVAEEQQLNKIFKLDEVLRLLPALSRALARHPMTVLIDELDQAWDNSQTANIFLSSLMTAAIQLRGYDPNLHVIVFLRSEIFDLLKLRLPQLDKLRSDMEVLRWSRRDLERLVVNRALYCLKLDPGLKVEGVARAVFPPRVGHDAQYALDYAISRTAHRPREVIQICNLILSAVVAQEGEEVTEGAVLEAEEEFSAWKRDHIASENMYIYPGLARVLEYFRGGPVVYDRMLLADLLTRVLVEAMDDEEAPSWLRELEAGEELLAILFQHEVLGVERRDGPAPGGSEVLSDLFEFSYARPNAKPERAERVLVHPSLWRALELG